MLQQINYYFHQKSQFCFWRLLVINSEIVPFFLAKLQVIIKNANQQPSPAERKTKATAPQNHILHFFVFSLTLCSSRRCDTKAFSEPALSGWCRWMSRRWRHHHRDLLTFICAAPYRLPPNWLSYTCTILFLFIFVCTVTHFQDNGNSLQTYQGMRQLVQQYL